MSITSTLLQFGVPARYARAAHTMLGHGVEGAAYLLEGGTRVLKVNVTARHQDIARVARRVRGKSWAAPIYSSGPLRPPAREGQGRGRGPRAAREAGALGFWYVAPRLFAVSARERQVLNALGFALMAHAKGSLPAPALAAKWKQGLALLPAGLQRTLVSARRAGYHDLHGGNVMRTSSGAYKVIDVESLRPLGRTR